MKLYAAPLQGFTEAPWRNLHQEVFGGIDAYYTPFVRMEKGEFRNKDVREIASGNNTVSRLIYPSIRPILPRLHIQPLCAFDAGYLSVVAKCNYRFLPKWNGWPVCL